MQSEEQQQATIEQMQAAKEARYIKKLKSILTKRGYVQSSKLIDTLQGQIWRAVRAKSGEKVVIKITSKDLANTGVIMIDGQKQAAHENILREKIILKFLTNQKDCPESFVKYVDFMKSNVNYYLVMSDGGHSLFDFAMKVHEYIEGGKILMSHWHDVVKCIMHDMLECVEYIHKNNVCHFDISLENYLINDLDVEYGADETLAFAYKDVLQIKLCDFGLAECFETAKKDSDAKEDEEQEENFMSNKYCGKVSYQSPEISNRDESKAFFDARKNDVWCVGVCLWMLITGSAPFGSSAEEDPYFQLIISGKTKELLAKWKKAHYVNDQLLEVFDMVFKYEKDRASIEQIKACKWLQ